MLETEEIGVKIYELCQQGELVIRIIIAALIGCMIGYERKNREKVQDCELMPLCVWGLH